MAIWKTSGSESGSKFCCMGCYTHTMINPRMLVSTMFWSTESAALTLSTWWSRVIAENTNSSLPTLKRNHHFLKYLNIYCPSNCPANEPNSHHFLSFTVDSPWTSHFPLSQKFTPRKNSPETILLDVRPNLESVGVWWGVLQADIWQLSW